MPMVRVLIALACLTATLAACRRAKTCDVTYDCPAGQTCAKTDPNEPFSCLKAGTAKAGDPCDATTNAPVTCAERLTCLATGAPAHGTCVAWCDDARSCPAAETCTHVATTAGDKLRVCAPCNLSYTCGAGETCATRDGWAFTCVRAGSDKVGAPCDAATGAAVTCGEELLCFSMTTPPAGRCTRWCDRTHPCVANKTCTPLRTTKRSVLSVCL